MKENNTLVSIINWNNNSATTECLESIAKIPKNLQPDIRLIDNDSRKEKMDIPKTTLNKLRSIELMVSVSNLGFAKAHNQSIDFAKKHGYDFVCLLNNDTVVNDKDLFIKLASVLDNNTLASAPTILDSSGKVWYAGGRFNKPTSTPSHHQVGGSPNNLKSSIDTPHITGCCVMINLSLPGNRLPEQYFMYWEDAEWSVRARKNGYKLAYVADTAITHNVSSSLGLKSPTYIYYIIRNNILFIKRNTTWHNKPLSYLKLMSVDAKYEIKALLSGWSTFKSVEKSLYKAWKHGLSGKTGKLK